MRVSRTMYRRKKSLLWPNKTRISVILYIGSLILTAFILSMGNYVGTHTFLMDNQKREVALSNAIVFPQTIISLTDSAEMLANQASASSASLQPLPASFIDLEQAEEGALLWQQHRTNLLSILSDLSAIVSELEYYQNQVFASGDNAGFYEYVSDGYNQTLFALASVQALLSETEQAVEWTESEILSFEHEALNKNESIEDETGQQETELEEIVESSPDVEESPPSEPSEASEASSVEEEFEQ